METNQSLRFSSQSYSPLKRDKVGNLRILIVGNSGAGKSTVAKKLSNILRLPVVHLDTLRFQRNWRETPDVEFRKMVQQFVHENNSWIIDGDFNRILGDIVNESATCILWMDTPFMLYFPRLIIRTFLCLIQSILWWSWTHHTPLKQAYTDAMQMTGDGQGEKWLRLSGWGREVNAWLEQVELFSKAQ